MTHRWPTVVHAALRLHHDPHRRPETTDAGVDRDQITNTFMTPAGAPAVGETTEETQPRP
ncbi:hypothetical protein GCM10023169_23770 [Georgenia halophila]|uniref:Uncharacterized protein n=1 Tax=Georgenia halophila TaxID=620889 RepID=A0ABP8LCC8_9MICO